jgi:hypothetical protein
MTSSPSGSVASPVSRVASAKRRILSDGPLMEETEATSKLSKVCPSMSI